MFAPKPIFMGAVKGNFPRAPLVIGICYLSFTFLLFLFGPVDYPVKNYAAISAYLVLIFLIMIFVFQFAARKPAYGSTLKVSRAIFIVGAISAIVILFPSSYYYAGAMPWEIFSSLGDQSSAYASLADQLSYTEGQRGPIIIARSLVMPFIWAVIPLGIIYWQRLSWFYRALWLSSVLCNLTFSALRGTDREVADLLIVSGSAYAIAAARKARERQPVARGGSVKPRHLLLRRWRVALVGVVALVIAGSVFVERKEGRMGTVSAFCFLNSGACADYSHPLTVNMNDSGRFATAMTTAYLTNGYYGLSLALEKPFHSSWGLGHSPALRRVYESFSGDLQSSYKTFNYRNVDEGWPQEFFWSTMITSIANDIGFLGAALFMGLFAWGWGRSWVDAVQAKNDSAAIVFCIAMFSIFYFPANLQILQTLEGYSVVVFWMCLWLFFRSRSATPS